MAAFPHKVAYNMEHPHHPVVGLCLQAKRQAVQMRGIGPESCCCYIRYKTGGVTQDIFGNSRGRVLYIRQGGNPGTACVHGELQALWNLYEDHPNGIGLGNPGDGTFAVEAMYIEMSPCEKCGPALHNLLLDGTVVFYSWDHPREVEAWQAAARALCR